MADRKLAADDNHQGRRLDRGRRHRRIVVPSGRHRRRRVAGPADRPPGAVWVLTWAYLGAALFIVGLGSSRAGLQSVVATTIGAGFCIIGGQIGANVLAANLYPTFIRSTGMSWALGIGRVGAIVGPLLVGLLLAHAWPAPTIFLMGAVPALIAALAVFAMGRMGDMAETAD